MFCSQVLFDSVFFRNNMRRRELCSAGRSTFPKQKSLWGWKEWFHFSQVERQLLFCYSPWASQQYCSWEKRWATGVSQKRQLWTVTEMVPCFSKIAFQPSRCKAAHRISWERGEGTRMEVAVSGGSRWRSKFCGKKYCFWDASASLFIKDFLVRAESVSLWDLKDSGL